MAATVASPLPMGSPLSANAPPTTTPLVHRRIEECLRQELYATARSLCSLVLSEAPKESSASSPSPASRAAQGRVLVWMGDAFVGLGQDRLAMQTYEQSWKLLASDPSQSSQSLEAMARFKFAKCARRVKEYAVAKDALQAVFAKHRTAAMLLLLGQLYEDCAEVVMATQVYRSLLKMSPYSVEAFDALLRLDDCHRNQPSYFQTTYHALSVNKEDVALQSLASWFHAKHLVSRYRYEDALTILVSLTTMHSNNPYLWLDLATTNLKLGDSLASFYAFQQVRHLAPAIVDSLDKFAALLRSQGNQLALNTLVTQLMAAHDQHPAAWVAMGRFCEMKGNRDRALVFAEKALSLDRKHAEAYLLKGTSTIDAGVYYSSMPMVGSLCVAMGRPEEAILQYRRAHKLEPDPFSLEGLMASCIAVGKNKEALMYAKEAARALPEHPRVLVSIGMVLHHTSDPEKAKKAFESALEKDPQSIEAVMGMVSFLSTQKQFSEAIRLMQKHVTYHHTDWMHTRLADLYLLLKECDKAMDHYNLALNINPDYERARAGIQRVEKILNGDRGLGDAAMRDGGEDGETSNEGEDEEDEDEEEDDFDMAMQ